MEWYLFLVVKGKNFSRGWPEFLFPVVNPKLSYFRLAFVWKIGSALIWLVRITTSLWSRPFVEDCAHSLAIEPQPEAVFLRELRDLCLSIFLVRWPEASQFTLVNNAMLPFANLQFAVDLARKCLHAAAEMFRARGLVRGAPFLSTLNLTVLCLRLRL